MSLQVRTHGASGPRVVVVHGGPGAPGSAVPLARGLASAFRVLEPWQRGAGGEPLTVARHVADLEEVVRDHGAGAAPAVVGHSWGAMLALAHAAAHPASVSALVLVGCGTFDRDARSRLEATLAARTDRALRERLQRLPRAVPDPDARLQALGELTLPLYAFDPVSTESQLAECDERAHRETWRDMLAQQDAGVYPAAFAAIEAPVLMLHGAADPHPGPLIRKSLEAHLPQLEYREWERCGHYPWLERHGRDDFFDVLRRWLLRAPRRGR